MLYYYILNSIETSKLVVLICSSTRASVFGRHTPQWENLRKTKYLTTPTRNETLLRQTVSKMLSILRKARLKDKEMRILMLYVYTSLFGGFDADTPPAGLTMPARPPL